MAKKRRRRKKQGKVVVKERAKLVHKGDSIGGDSLPEVKGRPPADVGVTFKVKVKRKR